jgi:hypothetical protein
MRFCDWKWEYEFEPSCDVVLAASYLEARGLQFLVDFSLDNAVVKAEARMQMEAMECGPTTPPTEH